MPAVRYGQKYLSGPRTGEVVEHVITFRTDWQAEACHRVLLSRLGAIGIDAASLADATTPGVLVSFEYAHLLRDDEDTGEYVRRLHRQAE